MSVKVAVDRKQLLKSVKAVATVVDQATGPYSNIIFRQNDIIACNQLIQARTVNPYGEQGLIGIVPAKLFVNLLGRLKDDNITITVENRSMSVQANRHCSTIPFLPVDSWSGLSLPSNVEVTEFKRQETCKDLEKSIDLCGNTINKMREDLNGVYFSSEGTIFSCDGFRLSTVGLGPILDSSFWIKRDLLKYFKKRGEGHSIVVTNSMVHIAFTDPFIILTFRLVKDAFPAPSYGESTIKSSEIVVAGIKDKTEVACEFVRDLTADSTMENNVTLTFTPTGLIWGFDGISNKITEQIDIQGIIWPADWLNTSIEVKPTWIIEGMQLGLKMSVIQRVDRDAKLIVFENPDRKFKQTMITKNKM